jgi:hypothetical protein
MIVLEVKLFNTLGDNQMKTIGSQTREKLEESGCVLYERSSPTEVILLDEFTGNLEVWLENDHAACYVIEIDGKGYEFAGGYWARN